MQHQRLDARSSNYASMPAGVYGHITHTHTHLHLQKSIRHLSGERISLSMKLIQRLLSVPNLPALLTLLILQLTPSLHSHFFD